MTTLPPATDFTGAAVTEGDFKVAITAMREYQADMFGTSSTEIDAQVSIDMNGKQFRQAKGADVASASTLNLGADGNYFDITGTTTITAIATEGIGTKVVLHFDGILILTHHVTNLLLPSGANITTAAGDEATFIEYASADWRCTNYSRADGTALVADVGLPASYLQGLTTSNNAGDSAHDIDIVAGSCRDNADSVDITLTSTFVKKIDVSWVAGTNQGGLSSSLTLTADTWYHLHAIVVAGSADIGWDTSLTAANLVTDHSATAFRRIGAVLTDSSSNILAFFQNGDCFNWKTPITDETTDPAGTTAVTVTLSVPIGLKIYALLVAATDNAALYISSLEAVDIAPVVNAVPLGSIAIGLAGGDTIAAPVQVWTNTSAQIRRRLSANEGSHIQTLGWVDLRGRNS